MNNDLISREQIRKMLNEAFGCENATKYGNKNAKQQELSYSTLMLYEIADIVEDCCDNAPTVNPKQGKWIYHKGDGYFLPTMECSNCHESDLLGDLTPKLYKDYYKFCFRCGADMRGGKG